MGNSARSPAFQNVLMVRLSALGDVVDCLPALSALRLALPRARIAWLVEARCAALLEDHPHLDDLLVVPRRHWVKSLLRPKSAPSAIAEVITFYAAQHHRRFDVVFDFHGNLKSGVNTLLTKAPLRYGLGPGDTREGNLLFQTHCSSDTAPRTHRVDRNLALLASAGIPVGEAQFVLPRDEEGEGRMESFARQVREGEGAVVLFHPHASPKGEYKRWPLEAWLALAQTLRETRGVRPVILWGPGEEGDARDLAERGKGILAPPTSLKELIALLRTSDCLVGADSGPVHLAWAAGTPTVALFGPKDPCVYGPYDGRGVSVYLGLDCSPCRDRDCAHVRCMAEMEDAQVFRAVEQVLDQGRRRP